jgi:plastocyanin
MRSFIAVGILGTVALLALGLAADEKEGKEGKEGKDGKAPPGEAEAEPEAPRKYPDQDPAKGALEGRIVFEGDMPQLKPIEIPANHNDRAACIEHVRNEDLILSKEKGIKNVVVSIADYKPAAEVKPAPQAITLDNHHCTFVPHVQATTAGSILTVTNGDSFIHNTHALLKNEFNNAVQKGDKLEKKLLKPGWMYITCDFHTWMKAYIWVFPHELFDVSRSDGSYKIVNVPPGEYTIEFWHEPPAMEPQKEKVKVEAGKSTKLDMKLHPRKK